MSRAGLRIVLGIESSGPGGAEHMVLRLAIALRSLGDETTIATMRPGWLTERAEAAGQPVWIVPQRAGLDLPWVFAFAKRLRQARIDVFHSHEFAMNVFGGAAALLARVTAISTIHGRHWVSDRPRRGLAYRMQRKLGIPINAVSEDLADFLAEGLSVPRSSLRAIHNGIPLAPVLTGTERAMRRTEARRAIGVPSDGPLLIAVGNLYPIKGHANLVRALAQVPYARLAIAGRGNEEEPLRKLARELGLEARVHLLGLRDDVETILLAGDIFVQPSRSEGLPLAVLEAMGAGLPVVASSVGGIPEAVEHGRTGYLVPPEDPGRLADSLRRILDAPDQGAGLGAAGRERVETCFSIEKMASHYRALYAERVSI